jgi:hypothetical protein
MLKKIDDNTQVTPLEDNVDKPVVDAATTDTKDQENITTDNTDPAVDVFDAQKNYDAMVSKYDALNKSYSEIRKEFTRRTQHESELQKKMDSLFKMMSDATETPIDPEQFIRDLQSQGPKALEPHFKKWVEPIQTEYSKAIEERDSKILKLETMSELERRRRDSESYPDFSKLESVMQEIVDSDDCPVNWNLGVGECYDLLYKLAKDRSAEEAVKIAREEGKKDAEKRLAKEANTAVAGGGKSPGATEPNWDELRNDPKKLREVVAQLYGVADRD